MTDGAATKPCRGWSLDFSTLVLDTTYDNLPGVEYYEVQTDQGTFRFAQGRVGVLPDLLKDLAAYRKAAKKKMAEAKARGDEFAVALHNGEQLAFKVTMNSAYGFAGANKGFLSCVPIAASVTATGRQMIAKTKGLVEQMLPGSHVVYGVSHCEVLCDVFQPVVTCERPGCITGHGLGDVHPEPRPREPAEHGGALPSSSKTGGRHLQDLPVARGAGV